MDAKSNNQNVDKQTEGRTNGMLEVMASKLYIRRFMHPERPEDIAPSDNHSDDPQTDTRVRAARHERPRD